MEAKRVSEIAEMLRGFAEYARDDVIHTYVCIEEDSYYVDLGSFGEQTMQVSLEDSYYELDPETLLRDHFPVSASEFEELAQELDAFARQLGGAPPTVERAAVAEPLPGQVTTITFDR